MHKNILKSTIAVLAFATFIGGFSGCSTPRVSKRSPIVDLDEQDSMRGIGSPEIRRVAGDLMPEILALPEIADAEGPVRIVLSRVANRTSHPMDMNIFARKMRAELQRNAEGKVRFIADQRGNANINETRGAVLKQRVERNRDKAISDIAKAIAGMKIFADPAAPKTIAVVPALNCNLVNLNADSFVAKLRSKISEYSGGTIGIMMPGETAGADYLLTGQFIADSIKQEGMVNLVDYISLMEERLREKEVPPRIPGSSQSINNSTIQNSVVVGSSVAHLPPPRRKALLDEIERSRDLRQMPDVAMSLNVILLDAKRRVSCFEKTFDLNKKFDDNSATANYILSGEVSSTSKRSRGRERTYYLFSFKLSDPETNEILWEGIVEEGKETRGGVVY